MVRVLFLVHQAENATQDGEADEVDAAPAPREVVRKAFDDQRRVELQGEDDQAVQERLRGLGYLE